MIELHFTAVVFWAWEGGVYFHSKHYLKCESKIVRLGASQTWANLLRSSSLTSANPLSVEMWYGHCGRTYTFVITIQCHHTNCLIHLCHRLMMGRQNQQMFPSQYSLSVLVHKQIRPQSSWQAWRSQLRTTGMKTLTSGPPGHEKACMLPLRKEGWSQNNQEAWLRTAKLAPVWWTWWLPRVIKLARRISGRFESAHYEVYS